MATTSNTTSRTKTLTRHPPRRGSTRYCRGSMPIASRTRTSPITRLVASSEAMAVPERPAMASAGMVAPVMIQERPRVIGQGLRRDLAVHALLGGLPRQGGEVRVLHQARRHRAEQVEEVVALHLVRLDLDDFARLDVDETGVD